MVQRGFLNCLVLAVARWQFGLKFSSFVKLAFWTKTPQICQNTQVSYWWCYVYIWKKLNNFFLNHLSLSMPFTLHSARIIYWRGRLFKITAIFAWFREFMRSGYYHFRPFIVDGESYIKLGDRIPKKCQNNEVYGDKWHLSMAKFTYYLTRP